MSDWKYDTDEVGEDGLESDEPDLEPGSPTAEHALFVALGVATMLLVFARIVMMAG